VVGQSADTWTLKQAIAECAQNQNNNNATPCATVATLITNGFLPTGYAPTAKFGTVTTPGGGVITITGTAPAASCVVTLTPDLANAATSDRSPGCSQRWWLQPDKDRRRYVIDLLLETRGRRLAGLFFDRALRYSIDKRL
jgi:hypothetical protein